MALCKIEGNLGSMEERKLKFFLKRFMFSKIIIFYAMTYGFRGIENAVFYELFFLQIFKNKV